MMRFNKTYRGLVIAGAVTSVGLGIGCGGSGSPASSGFPGGGSGSGSNIPVGPGVDGGSTMRTLANGDSYVYKVTGKVTMEVFDATFAKRTVTGDVTGSMVRHVTATTYNAIPCFQISDSLVFTPTGGSPVSEFSEKFVTQAADGTVSVIGHRDHSVSFNAAAATAVWGGTFSTGTGTSASVRFTNDAADYQADKVVDTSFTLVGQDAIAATVGGSFTTWKANWAMHELANIYPIPRVVAGIIIPKGFVSQVERTESGTEWWAPGFSAPVKMTMQVSENDTAITSWTYSSGTFTRSDDVLHSISNLTMTLQAKTLN